MYKHICKKCGKTFENNNNKSIYCSNKCKNDANKDNFLNNAKKLINKKFGKLTILDAKAENGKIYFWCLCECGNKIWVSSGNLKNGHTNSCGCSRISVYKDGSAYREKNYVENTNLKRLTSITNKNNQSGIKGVHFHSQSNKWVAKLTFQRHTYSKEFKNKEDAIKYRKELEEKYFNPILEKYNIEKTN